MCLAILSRGPQGGGHSGVFRDFEDGLVLRELARWSPIKSNLPRMSHFYFLQSVLRFPALLYLVLRGINFTAIPVAWARSTSCDRSCCSKNALFRPALLLVSAGAAKGKIELPLLERLAQGFRLSSSPAYHRRAGGHRRDAAHDSILVDMNK